MSYQDVNHMLIAVGITPPESSSDADKAQAQLFLDTAGSEIDAYCGRTFALPDEAEERAFDAVPACRLYLNADLLPEPAPMISIDDTPFDESDYVLLLGKKQPTYDRVMRLSEDVAALWSDAIVSGRRTGRVKITGKWCYDIAVPNDVVLVDEEMAALMWADWKLHYSGGGGGDSFGTVQAPSAYMTAKHKQMLRPYVRRDVPQITGD